MRRWELLSNWVWAVLAASAWNLLNFPHFAVEICWAPGLQETTRNTACQIRSTHFFQQFWMAWLNVQVCYSAFALPDVSLKWHLNLLFRFLILASFWDESLLAKFPLTLKPGCLPEAWQWRRRCFESPSLGAQRAECAGSGNWVGWCH